MLSDCRLCNQQSTSVVVISAFCKVYMTTIIAVICAHFKQVWLQIHRSICAPAACVSTALRCCCLRPTGYFQLADSGAQIGLLGQVASGIGQVVSHLRCTPSSAQRCLTPESGLHSHSLGALALVPTECGKHFFCP